MALDFGNTEIAFKSRSNSVLQQAYWMFRLISFPWAVRLGQKVISLALALHLPVEGIIRRTVFRHFCGGETIEESGGTIQKLAESHVGTILDYSVEAAQTETDFDATTAEISRTIDVARGNPHLPFCVVKVTGIARFALLEKLGEKVPLTPDEQAEWARVRGRLLHLCEKCHSFGVRLFIDAEESWIHEPIDALTTEMMQLFNRDSAVVYFTSQMYRTGRHQLLERSYDAATSGGYWLGIKIVRGAYMEKERARAAQLGVPSPILPTKQATDEAYNDALKFCIARLKNLAICAGTHNESSAKILVTLMEENKIAKNDKRVFFSQLLGMSDHLSYNLAAAGYNVAKYVPYGPVRATMPYLFRRAEENTSIAGQTSRELLLLSEELQRRKK